MKKVLIPVLILSGFYQVGHAQQQGYYRTPAIHGNIVVFSSEGDLWKYDMTTAVVNRLTTYPGWEGNPVISPDGKQIVFSGQYENVGELYLIDINGSIPRRLTYDNWYNRPVGWAKDGKIIYASSRYSNLNDLQLIKLDPVTLSTEMIPLAQISDGSYDESNMLYFSRLPKQGSSNKRYVGGTIQQIWKFDGKQEAKCLTCDFNGTSYHSMIYKDRIYFASDRDGSMNIWSMDKEGKSLKQHTFSKEWDIKSPSSDGAQIIYQKGADLYVYNIESNSEKMLDIRLISDFDQRKSRWIKNPSEAISFTTLSPEGNFTAIITRGRLFVIPSKGDRWVEINRKPGVRIREVQFLTEKTVAYLSDESGEFEIWKTAADGSGSPQQLTKNTKTLINTLKASPDGKYIAFKDKNELLRIIDSGSGNIKFEIQDQDYGIADMYWSANSDYFVFAHGIENLNLQMSLVEIESGRNIPITTPRLDSYSASWSKDNHWIYFLSDRNLQTKVSSPWGSRQPEPYYTETTNLYALQVDTTDKFPFLEKDGWVTDTVSTGTPTAANKKTKNEKSGKIPPPIKKIDWQHIAQQIFQVPAKSGNIRDLSVADGFLYWIDAGNGSEGSAKLFALKMAYDKKMEPVEIVTGLDYYQLSSNKKKILVARKKTFAVADANGEKLDFEKNKIDLANWKFQVNPVEEWRQMFADAWRMMRDYFYDRNMHNVDWLAVRKQHQPLVDRLTDRSDLNDLVAQMVAELSALHTFVVGGDTRRPTDEIQTGSLGARLEKDAKGLKIAHIYRSDPDYPEERSPLSMTWLSVREGDIITGVNDIPLTQVQDISELLANKVGIQVKLNLINQKGETFSQIVKPISSNKESDLRYSEWELTRRMQVDSASKDEIGYVHLRAMTSRDMDDFVKQFYPVFTRKGLIIDVRHNGGGNIDSWVLEKLMRKAWFYWQGRTGKPVWNMQYAFRGHMVLLCDQFTGSDGEAIAEGFRRLGLGKVVGMRTWGGEIWLSFDNTLVDDGIASAAELGVFGPEGKWLIEGHGVDPDFVVDNLPNETFKGKDAQLEFAIDYLKKKIEKEPVDIPKAPAYPDKSFKYKTD